MPYLDWLIYKMYGRVRAAHDRYVRELREERLAASARIHATALVDDVATIVNHSENPDDVVIGANSSIQGHLLIMPQGGKIVIGEKSLVGPGTKVWSAGSITIGSYVMISHNVNIHDNNSHSLSWRERREEIDHVYPHLRLYKHAFDLKAKPVVIEDDVWVGFGSSILKGVRVGRGALIGAGTMVTEDVAPFTIVGGNPMRVLKKLDPET